MTINEILQTLEETKTKLESGGVDDSSKMDLDILILQLKRSLQVAIFDPLKDLDQITVADTTQLRNLTSQVQQVIDNEQARATLVTRIVGTAKVVLKAAGLPIPS